MARARTAIEADQPRQAMVHLGRGARAYLPLFGVHREARLELVRLARVFEDSGKQDLALLALRDVRGAILGTRWLLTSDRDLLSSANEDIVRLTAGIEPAVPGHAGLDPSAHLALLERDSSSAPVPSLLAVLLFLSWLFVTGWGSWASVTAGGQVRWDAVKWWLPASLGLLGSWLCALALA
jgi:hypothetical protein